MTTKEVAEKYNVSQSTINKWCKKQTKLKRILGKQGIMEYVLTDKDVEAFLNRRPKGRPKSSLGKRGSKKKEKVDKNSKE